jgi:hypothetical protein
MNIHDDGKLKVQFEWGKESVGDGFLSNFDAYIMRAKYGGEKIRIFISLEVLEDHFRQDRPWQSLSIESLDRLRCEGARMIAEGNFSTPTDNFLGKDVWIRTLST